MDTRYKLAGKKKNSVSIKDEKKINQVSVLLIPCNPTQQKKRFQHSKSHWS